MRQHPFDLLMELEEDSVRLDCAALHLSRDRRHGAAIDGYLAQLDELAERIAAKRPGLESPLRYAAMREVLVEEEGFRGNDEDYYDPRNFYLDCVLERRIGIPITLSVVWIEVGRRLKWPVAGVGFPGHFLVRFDDTDRFVVADPFNRGESLSLEDCTTLLDNKQPGLKFCLSMLDAVGTRAVLLRMLSNLRTVYLCGGQWTAAMEVLERLIAADPKSAAHVQELALLCKRTGDLRRAYGHLAAFIHRCPESREFQDVYTCLLGVEDALAAMN